MKSKSVFAYMEVFFAQVSICCFHISRKKLVQPHTVKRALHCESTTEEENLI